jgi:pSer/pThr/pTyr-binding forkhead associated (FHA) protein
VECSRCGQQVPDDANFCPACGAPLVAAGASDTTTAAIDVGALDPHHEVAELPALEPGTGMLVVVRGPNAGSRFLLDREQTTIGRHPDSDIFLDDVTVSRRHAALSREGTTLVARDLGSLNGSYVNGERVEERVLATGDELQIGRFKLLFVGDSGAVSGGPLA